MKREFVNHLKDRWSARERRLCRLIQIHRNVLRYQSHRRDDSGLRLRTHILLRREGWKVNKKRGHRIYLEERLQVRTKRRKKKGFPDRWAELGKKRNSH